MAKKQHEYDMELREDALKLTPLGRKILESSYQVRVDDKTIQLIKRV